MKTKIESIKVFPDEADHLYVQNSFSLIVGGVPLFYYEFQNSDGVCLKSGSVSMESEQWNGWDADVDDETYILESLAENLGVIIVQD